MTPLPGKRKPEADVILLYLFRSNERSCARPLDHSVVAEFAQQFIQRGDQIGAWSYPLLKWLGLGLTGISFVAAPLAALWCVLSLWLGRKQKALASAR
jgi:hypothetical protein